MQKMEMGRILVYIILGAALLLAPSMAFYLAPSLSGASNPCTQVSPSIISCQDGASPEIGFTISEQYAPEYGNFTVYSTQPYEYGNPVGVDGNQCQVSSDTVQTCFIALAPAPLSMGYGITSENVSLKLVSNTYPQIFAYSNFSITIEYYLTGQQSELYNTYEAAASEYEYQNSTYANLCLGIGICNQSIESYLSNSSYELAYADSFINGYNTSAVVNSVQIEKVLYYAQRANATLNGEVDNFSAFVGSSNIILDYAAEAKSNMASAENEYNGNYSLIQKCNAISGKNYSAEIYTNMNYITAYSSPKSVQGSETYLNNSLSFDAEVGQTIASCKRVVEAAASQDPTGSTTLPVKSSAPTQKQQASTKQQSAQGTTTQAGFLSYQYRFVIWTAILAIITLYARSKYIEYREIRGLRNRKRDIYLEPGNEDK